MMAVSLADLPLPPTPKNDGPDLLTWVETNLPKPEVDEGALPKTDTEKDQKSDLPIPPTEPAAGEAEPHNGNPTDPAPNAPTPKPEAFPKEET
jgi:hypothetical protein